jgi:hypothetical protein
MFTSHEHLLFESERLDLCVLCVLDHTAMIVFKLKALVAGANCLIELPLFAPPRV